MAAGYLMDENVDIAYRNQLALRGSLPVRIVGESEAPPAGTTDPEILE